jgi:hypothetical protein
LFIATHVSIRTSDSSSIPLETPSQPYGTLLYHRCNPHKTLINREHERTQLNRSAPRAIQCPKVDCSDPQLRLSA